MKLEDFLGRLDRGRANTYTYCSSDVRGQIDIFRAEERFVLQWEECDPEDIYTDSRLWMQETHHFDTVDQVLEFLDGNALPVEHFSE